MVLSHLLGHEGPGSLYAALQDEGLANSLSSGMRTAHEDFSLFQVKTSVSGPMNTEGGRGVLMFCMP